MRIKALFSLAALGFASLAFGQVVEEKKSEVVTVVVKETPKPPAFVFELHGFISTTGYFQDANFFSTGQKALFVQGSSLPAPASLGLPNGTVFPTAYEQDKPLVGFDVRQSRLNFSVRGPEVMGGAVPKAVAEFDFFGSDEVAAASMGAFSDVSIFPRIRVLYAELNWGQGRHILQLGQQNMLTVGVIPQSLSHIAFPATYTAGTVGWRQPGIWGFHTFGDDTKFEFAWSIQRSGWANNSLHDSNINDGIASGLPAFEARGTLKFGKALDFWLTGHWQSVDTNGPNVIAVQENNTNLVTALGVAGMKANIGPFALAGSAWYGKNAGPLLGNVLQFTPASLGYRTDIFGYGAWGQIGATITNNLSIWYTYGIDHPVYDNIYQIAGQYASVGTAAALSSAAALRLRNQNMVAMVRYQDGNFAMGAEWLYSRTTNVATDTQGLAPLIGNQISLTGNYYF